MGIQDFFCKNKFYSKKDGQPNKLTASKAETNLHAYFTKSSTGSETNSCEINSSIARPTCPPPSFTSSSTSNNQWSGHNTKSGGLW